MSEAKVIVRQAQKQDKDFILSSWLKGQYWGSKYWQQMEQDLYFEMYAIKIGRLLTTPTAQIEVAVLEDAPDDIMGYIAYDGDTILWTYVKADYRSQGILNMLLTNKPFTQYSADTKPGQAIGKKKGLKFNPIGA